MSSNKIESLHISEAITLSGDMAMQLWKKGKVSWNAWVEENPNANVELPHPLTVSGTTSSVVSFAEFEFPTGHFRLTGVAPYNPMSFSGAIFNSSSIDFSKLRFDRGVDFSNAVFKGEVTFNSTYFGGDESRNELVSFENVEFKEKVSFQGANFNLKYISFNETVFSGASCSFQRANIFNTSMQFKDAQFNCMAVSFSRITLKSSLLTFQNAQFSCFNIRFDYMNCNEGDIWFNKAKIQSETLSFFESTLVCKSVDFTESILDCSFVKFDNSKIDASIDFNNALFTGAVLSFERCLFNGHADFSNMQTEDQSMRFSFKSSTFNESLDLSYNDFSGVVDLTNTETSNQISLVNLKCAFNKILLLKSADPLDTERLRRLKEISKSNNDHVNSLRFHADEMRSKRWHYGAGVQEFIGSAGVSVIDTVYDLTCDYGQSISRPVLWLLLIVSLFTSKYANIIGGYYKLSDIGNIIMFSLGNSLPFIPISKLAREEKIRAIFTEIPPTLYDWMVLQGGLSFVFIFLIGLGLRNRFKI